MIDATTFARIIDELGDVGRADIDWADGCRPPDSAERFAEEAIYVICNSGMKNTVARRIYDDVMPTVRNGLGAKFAFGHEGKCRAIDLIWRDRARLHAEYMAQPDDARRVWYCSTLPWIGEITKYHLAKNFGVQVAKPDVHLQRLADLEQTTPQALCERLAVETGYRVATVDVLLWRACANGLINSRTARFTPIRLTEAHS